MRKRIKQEKVNQQEPSSDPGLVGLKGFSSWSEAVGLHTPGCCGHRASEEMILFWDKIPEKQFDMAQPSFQPP